MPSRSVQAVLPLAAALLLGLAGQAQAQSDPLLSGYGGPGSGDQSVLGSTLLPPSSGGGSRGNGGGGIRAAPPAAAAAPAVTPAPTATSSSPQAAGTARPNSTDSRRPRTAGTSKPAAAPARTSAPAAPVLHQIPAAAAVTDHGAATSTSSLPVAPEDLLLVLVVLAAVGGLAIVSARLARDGRATG